jgi:L-seryl-tRNA(Ser) seleniumtransferase
MSSLRNLPKVDVLAQDSKLAGFSDAVRNDAARCAIAYGRSRIQSGAGLPALSEIADYAVVFAAQMTSPSLKRVINASGVILHTGIGRSRLASAAADAIEIAARHHSAVEIDLETGKRGDRQEHVRGLLCDLTGAADAFVVNNCAASVFLALTATCQGKGVYLSRGQMVEIGGSFRMPDIVRQSGCRLIEVGCTNKTRISDYSAEDDAAAILRCHPSNFKIIGFAEEPSVEEVASHAHENGWILIDDIGSGALSGSLPDILQEEPVVQRSLIAGADLVLSSGDKLLGATQAGIILGSKSAIQAIRQHPLTRAMRIDKLSLAGLEATLRLHAQGRSDEIPTLWAIRRPKEEVKRAAIRIRKAIGDSAQIEAGFTEIGGGSAPGLGISTFRVGIRTKNTEELAKKLRLSTPAVLSRIEKNMVWIDPRTMDEQDVRDAVKILRSSFI